MSRTERPICVNSGLDAAHAKRPAPYEHKRSGPLCASCYREATADCCVDCRAAGRPLDRPAPHPGPRCVTDHRTRKRARSLATRERNTRIRFGLTPEARSLILAAQDGACAICQRAREVGAFSKGGRRLAVDHDHTCCPGPTSCGQCVRGLLCAGCNDLLAHVRDDVETLRRAVAYLLRPPARVALLALDEDPTDEDLVDDGDDAA